MRFIILTHAELSTATRDEGEVSYLRKKRIFVPNVAEIENIFMIEAVIRAVARHYRRDENEVFRQGEKIYNAPV